MSIATEGLFPQIGEEGRYLNCLRITKLSILVQVNS